jgi:hypothetical protein
MIVGGEKYMWVAYGVVWGGMVLYLASLFRRRKVAEAEYEVFTRRAGADGAVTTAGEEVGS